MNNKLTHPKETICLLLFEKPMTVEKLCMALYGKKKNSRLHGWLGELEKAGWIKEQPELKDDRRYKYYIANPFCIRYYLTLHFEEKKIKLSKDENMLLRDIIKSIAFRKYVRIIVDRCLNTGYFPTLRVVTECLSSDCAYLSFKKKYLQKYTKIKSSENIIKESKISDSEKKDFVKVTDIDDLDKIFNTIMPISLLDKIASLDQGMTSMLNIYFNDLSQFVKDVHNPEVTKSKVKAVNGNGHGLL